MENRVLDILPDSVMLRAEWMYDYYLYRDNYFTKIVTAADSVAFCPRQYRGVTYVKEVAENIPAVSKLPGGAYNFGSETGSTLYEITDNFITLLGRNIMLQASEDERHNLWMDVSVNSTSACKPQT